MIQNCCLSANLIFYVLVVVACIDSAGSRRNFMTWADDLQMNSGNDIEIKILESRVYS